MRTLQEHDGTNATAFAGVGKLDLHLVVSKKMAAGLWGELSERRGDGPPFAIYRPTRRAWLRPHSHMLPVYSYSESWALYTLLSISQESNLCFVKNSFEYSKREG